MEVVLAKWKNNTKKFQEIEIIWVKHSDMILRGVWEDSQQFSITRRWKVKGQKDGKMKLEYWWRPGQEGPCHLKS